MYMTVRLSNPRINGPSDYRYITGLLPQYIQWTEFHQTLVNDVLKVNYVTMNWLGFEGCGVEVKVATRSDVKTSEPHIFWTAWRVTTKCEVIVICQTGELQEMAERRWLMGPTSGLSLQGSYICPAPHRNRIRGHCQGCYKVRYLSELLWVAEMSTSMLGRLSSRLIVIPFCSYAITANFLFFFTRNLGQNCG